MAHVHAKTAGTEPSVPRYGRFATGGPPPTGPAPAGEDGTEQGQPDRSETVQHALSAWAPRVALLAGHVHAEFGVVVVDELAADVHGHAVDRAGELERAGVVVGDRRAGVGAAGEGTGIEDERRGDGSQRVSGEGAGHVQLEPPRRTLAGRQVRRPGRLELEPEGV